MASWLDSYIRLTEFLGQVLGPDYEVVLHDLTDRNGAVVAISNGHISGRTIGASLSAPWLQAIQQQRYETVDFRINYTGVAGGGRLLRSSNLLIKAEAGKPVGLLSLSFDDRRYRGISDSILKLCHPDSFVNSQFQFGQTIAEISETAPVGQPALAPTEQILRILAATRSQLQLRDGRPSLKERTKLVRALDAQGCFQLKGAVKLVADQLQCSPQTIYRYLAR